MSKIAILNSLMVVFLLGCSAQTNSNGFGKSAPNQIAPSATSAPAPAAAGYQVIIVPSELIVGQNRFAVGLIDPRSGMVDNARVHFRYFDLNDPAKPTVESEADAQRQVSSDGDTTIYAQDREFKRAGNWGVEVQAQMPGTALVVKRVSFQVVAASPTLKPGMKAPALATRIASDVGGDLHKLSSATEPNPAFYQLRLSQAISNGKPTVLLFATPAFCQTRLCGPSYDTVSDLQKKYGDALNFVHVEIYTGLPNPAATNYQLDPAMTAFGLSTEPWIFVIDKTGTITWRVEGLVTNDEIEQHLKPVIDF
jgi:hypothetical protein